MTTPELPPLDLHCESGRAHAAYTPDSVEARERILLARIAELEADAERYRWLRSEETGDWEVQSLILPLGAGQYTILEGGELDAAIDAARGKE